MKKIERFTQEVVRAPNKAVTEIITIPVVVHVVYHTEAENISDVQVLSQIDILNEDFRRMNADADNTWPQAADIEIEFCLATRDPAGNPTSGITRTYTEKTIFSADNKVKYDSTGGKDAWPTGQYLNIWVCNLDFYLGYAQYPGEDAATDGVVCDDNTFGNTGTATAPFNLGRTATHEVGHWLNLRHIWGDGDCSMDDLIGDTPPSDGPNFGCNPNQVSCETTDMVQNYMDYSDDGCMNLFTQGQKDWMRALFAPGGARESLLSSTACSPLKTCQDDDLTLSGNLTSGSHEFIAANTITASNVVHAGVNVQYYAGSSIVFEAGTHFRANSELRASIDYCTGTNALVNNATPEVMEHLQEGMEHSIRPKSENRLSVYPNPVGGKTTIEYALAEKAKTSLLLFDVMGKRKKVLLDGVRMEQGEHTLELSASSLSAGTYILVLQQGQVRKSVRLTVLP